jgi:diguanylate cyclase
MAEELLGRISETIVSAQTTEQLTRPLLALLEMVTGLETTYLTRVDQAAGVQNVLYARSSQRLQIPEGLTVPWSDTLCKRAIDEGRLFTDDVTACWPDSDAAAQLGIKTYVTTPVLNGDGSLFGTLCAASTERHPLKPEGKQMLTMFGALIQQQLQREHLVTQLLEANATLESYSFSDPLTGLPNRRAVVQALPRVFAQAQQDRRKVLVAFIDLDGFKQINDTYGHEAGDEFLMAIGARLRAGLGDGTVVGRLGGDEFAVLSEGPSLEDRDVTSAIAAIRKQIDGLLRGEFRLESCHLHYDGASIGAVCVDPRLGSPQQALRDADAAMYADKMARRGHVASPIRN